MRNDSWTQTPNFILDNMPNMKPAVFKVCMAVVRKTFGYTDKNGARKVWDRISISQFMEATGLSNRAVIDAVEVAVSSGWIEKRANGQWFDYRVSEQTYENSSQVDNETHENSSQETHENSSQVDETHENSSQEPMKIVHTQKKKERTTKVVDASTDASPKVCADDTESQKWFGALCWLVNGHQDYKLLAKVDRIAIGKTVKEIRGSPEVYTLDDLRDWYSRIWSTEWPGKQPKANEVQRPTLKQVRNGIGRVKAKAPSSINLNGSTAPAFSQDFQGSEA